MKNIKFLIVDDHQMIRESLTRLLHRLYPHAEVTEAADEVGAVREIKAGLFQLVIMDVHMPGSDATGLLEYLHAAFPACPVIVYSMHEERIYEQKFLQAGARAYVSKAADTGELEKAIDRVLRGRKYINADQWLSSPGPAEKNQKPFERLSAREFQIALLLLNGESVAQISNRLSIHTSTTGTHKANIFRKVGAKNMADFIRIAQVQHIRG